MKSYYVLENNLHPAYQEALRKEIRIESKWGNAVPEYSETLEVHPKSLRYKNLQLINQDTAGEFDWYKILYDNHKPVDFGLSLGTGTGRHQMSLLNAGFVKRWDSIDLVIDKGELFWKGKAKAESITGDLNFIHLEEKKYPFIFCHGILHHIINIEHLLTEINKALTDDGIFFVNEYIGESKWLFTPERFDYIEKTINERFPDFPIQPVVAPRSLKRMNLRRPLESVRSAEIYGIINQVFKNSRTFEFLRNPFFYSAINVLTARTKKFLQVNRDLLNEMIDFLIAQDKVIMISKLFKPTELIGIYKKSKESVEFLIKPWTDNEIKYNLKPDLNLYEKMKQLLIKVDFIKKMYKNLKYHLK